MIKNTIMLHLLYQVHSSVHKLTVSFCISPEDKVLEKRLPPSDGTVEAAAAVIIVLPRPRLKATAGCCGAVAVRTEPNDKPAGAAEEVELVVREKGVAEAVGLLKGILKPVATPVAAGAPGRKYIEKRL